MNPENITLVQQSWRQVVPIAEQASALFYARLFELDPTLQPLFKTDPKAQGRKLTSMINTAVVNLGRLDELVTILEDLGRRHAGYGVKPADYDTVAEALLWTLAKGLGSDFTRATRQAWTEAYSVLATTMQRAAAATERKAVGE